MKNKYDLLKVFAILLVVLGHITNHYETRYAQLITWAIYIFHMPLFIAISGAVFKMGVDKGKYQEFMPFIRNKITRLIIPFVISAVLLVAPTLVCCGESEFSYIGTVVDIFEGGACMKHLWFLPALFWMFVMIWGATRIKINLAVVFVVSLVASIASKHISILHCVLGLDAAIQKFPFFVLGMMAVGGNRVKLWRIGAFIAYITLCMLSVFVIKRCPFFTVKDVSGIILNASAVCCCICLADIAWRYLNDSRICAYLAKQSFGIYLFHMIPIWVLRHWCNESVTLWILAPVTFAVSIFFSIIATHIVRICRLQFTIGER